MSIVISPAVASAIAADLPVVALESTIIAHGFPRGRNLELAIELERIVTAGGATPATVAILDGKVTVGLDGSQLERIATEDIAKCNVANMAVTVAQGLSGATTVSATLRAARLAGIAILATGGIGGVHRSSGLDISADLDELGAAPIAVVSAGAKAFLDIPATLEYLETAGVTVVGYGADEFPAFYSPSSGVGVADRVDSPAEAAAVVAAARELGGGGVLIANPIAAQHSIAGDEVEGWTTEALARADAAGVAGLARSPFVLSALAEISGGRTVASNAALAAANTELATAIAVELAGGGGHRSVV